MNNKVILILSDGIHPDSIAASNHPCAAKLLSEGKYTLRATTV